MDLQTLMLWALGLVLGYYVACHFLVSGRAA